MGRYGDDDPNRWLVEEVVGVAKYVFLRFFLMVAVADGCGDEIS